jgi:hypothetical protein
MLYFAVCRDAAQYHNGTALYAHTLIAISRVSVGVSGVVTCASHRTHVMRSAVSVLMLLLLLLADVDDDVQTDSCYSVLPW